MTFSPLELSALSVLEQAAEAQFGLIVRVEDLSQDRTASNLSFKAKDTLYRVRKELGDPRFMQLRVEFSLDDPERELWIFNPGAEKEE